MQRQVIQQTAATQQQQQTVTQQQVQFSHLLELPADALADDILKATEENPALEREEQPEGPEASAADGITLGYGPEAPAYVRRSAEPAGADMASWTADPASDGDILARQIAELDLTDGERTVMDYIAGSLNAHGYLEKDDQTLADELAFGLYMDVSPHEVRRLVGLFQTLEPTGIGARNLQECLSLQLAEPHPEDTPETRQARRLALRIVAEVWDDYAARRLDKVARLLNVPSGQVAAADRLIRRCNPYPGNALTAANPISAPTVSPDFMLLADENGHIDISLTRQADARLKVSPAFLGIVESYPALPHPTRQQQDSYIYAKDKVDTARAYLANLQRRREVLLHTMQAIADRQRPFFLGQDEEALLQPLRLQDVADRVGIDVSTVSRAAASKYVQTAYGIYPLRRFFNAQTMEKDGRQVSNTQLKLALRELIEGEDPARPLSDEQLCRLMQQQGYRLARRTVAKYRDQMGIPTAGIRSGNV